MTAKKPVVPHAVTREVRRRMVRNAARGGLSKALYEKDRGLSIALKREREALLAELGENASTPSAAALVDAICRTRVLLDTVDTILMQIGADIVNRRKRVVYPILAQRQHLADSLVSHLKAFAEIKYGIELEKRIAALEEGRTINGLEAT